VRILPGSEDEVGERRIGSPAPAEASEPARPQTVGEMIDAALRGELSRDPKSDFQLLQPAHINVILDKASGFTNKEIAEQRGFHPVYVGKILRHPDAEMILARVLGHMADEAMDPIRRLQGYAHEAINTKIEIMRTSKSEGMRDRVATDILDRAGYGAKRQVEVSTPRFDEEVAQNAAAMNRLADVLAESQRIRDIPFTPYVTVPKPVGGVVGALKASSSDGSTGIGADDDDTSSQPTTGEVAA